MLRLLSNGVHSAFSSSLGLRWVPKDCSVVSQKIFQVVGNGSQNLQPTCTIACDHKYSLKFHILSWCRWVSNIAAFVGTALLSEWLCLRQELRDIPIGLALSLKVCCQERSLSSPQVAIANLRTGNYCLPTLAMYGRRALKEAHISWQPGASPLE